MCVNYVKRKRLARLFLACFFFTKMNDLKGLGSCLEGFLLGAKR
jgi:hypothetical protein